MVKGEGTTHKGSGFVWMANIEDADKAENISKAYWNEKLWFLDKTEA